MSTNILEQFAALIGDQAFMAVNTVVVNTLNDIQTEPQAWLNPLTGPVKGAAAVAALAGALPTLESTSVTSAAQLVETLWSQLGAKLASVAPTPAQTAATVTTALTPGA